MMFSFSSAILFGFGISLVIGVLKGGLKGETSGQYVAIGLTFAMAFMCLFAFIDTHLVYHFAKVAAIEMSLKQ